MGKNQNGKKTAIYFVIIGLEAIGAVKFSKLKAASVGDLERVKLGTAC